MRYVSQMGGLFKMTNAQYVEFIAQVATGTGVYDALCNCGAKEIGTVENATDWTKEDGELRKRSLQNVEDEKLCGF